MKPFTTILAIAAVFAAAGAAHAAGLAPVVVGQKLDSGLGSLPHYSQWTDRSGRNVVAVNSTRVEGESLDDGVGSLPHYSKWKSAGVAPTVQVALNSAPATR